MAKIIAVAGKGGVGKTTLTGLMIQYMCENGKTPILAVDADANSNLNEVLGVEAPPTLGEIREEIERAGMALHSPIPAGMTKGDYLQMRLEDAITEEKDFDLMVMGRTQGQGLAQQLGVPRIGVVANKVRNEADEAFIRAQIPESELLGIIHFNEDVMNADRSNVSPFDNSAQLVSEIITIKTKLDALDSLT